MAGCMPFCLSRTDVGHPLSFVRPCHRAHGLVDGCVHILRAPDLQRPAGITTARHAWQQGRHCKDNAPGATCLSPEAHAWTGRAPEGLLQIRALLIICFQPRGDQGGGDALRMTLCTTNPTSSISACNDPRRFKDGLWVMLSDNRSEHPAWCDDLSTNVIYRPTQSLT